MKVYHITFKNLDKAFGGGIMVGSEDSKFRLVQTNKSKAYPYCVQEKEPGRKNYHQIWGIIRSSQAEELIKSSISPKLNKFNKDIERIFK